MEQEVEHLIQSSLGTLYTSLFEIDRFDQDRTSWINEYKYVAISDFLLALNVKEVRRYATSLVLKRQLLVSHRYDHLFGIFESEAEKSFLDYASKNPLTDSSDKQVDGHRWLIYVVGNDYAPKFTTLAKAYLSASEFINKTNGVQWNWRPIDLAKPWDSVGEVFCRKKGLWIRTKIKGQTRAFRLI